MKRNAPIVGFAVCLFLPFCLIMTKCTSALKDVQIMVNPDVFKYTSLLEVSGSSGASIDDASVTLGGTDADKIFNMKGHRDFKIKNGFLTFALDPKFSPLNDMPIEFNVVIKKKGYKTVNIPVEILEKDSSTFRNVEMIDMINPPEGVESKINNLKVLSGKVIYDTTIYLGPGTCNCTTGKTTIRLKEDTGFKGMGGSNIDQTDFSNIEITSLFVDVSSNDALNFFPGASLTQKKVKVPDDSFKAGTLLPAGLIDLTMTTNGTDIEGLTSPMEVNIRLNESYTNPSSHQPVKVGDELKIFSFSTETGYFQYERSAIVARVDGYLTVHFLTDHLSWFMVGDFVEACSTNAWNSSSGIKLRVDAPWLGRVVATPVTLEVYSTKNEGKDPDLLIFSISSKIKDGDILPLGNVPGMAVIVKILDAFGNKISSIIISDPCSLVSRLKANGYKESDGAWSPILLNRTHATDNATKSPQLYVRSSNRSLTIDLLPAFFPYFKPPGSSENDYVLVRKVVKGYISSALLNVNNKYEIKAVCVTG